MENRFHKIFSDYCYTCILTHVSGLCLDGFWFGLGLSGFFTFVSSIIIGITCSFMNNLWSTIPLAGDFYCLMSALFLNSETKTETELNCYYIFLYIETTKKNHLLFCCSLYFEVPKRYIETRKKWLVVSCEAAPLLYNLVACEVLGSKEESSAGCKFDSFHSCSKNQKR